MKEGQAGHPPDVRIMMQLRMSLKRSRSGFCSSTGSPPRQHGCQQAAARHQPTQQPSNPWTGLSNSKPMSCIWPATMPPQPPTCRPW